MKTLLNLTIISCFFTLLFYNYSKQVHIEKSVQKIASKHDFSGSMLLVVGDSVKVSYAGEYSNREKKIINNDQTIFYIGSTSKQYTSAAIINLVNNGIINLSDKIVDFFPNCPADKREITLHQLLTHSSGLNTYHEIEGIGPDENITDNEALKRIFNQSLKFKPGSGFSYSNSGYVLLAIIIQKITKKSFKEYIKETFFKPNRMNNTGFSGDTKWNRDQVATGYSFDGITHPYDRTKLSWTILGSGGMVSSIEDYNVWLNYILNSSLKEKLFKPRVDYPLTNKNAKYGYGWIIEDNSQIEKIIYHNGGSTNTGGIASVRIYPKYNSYLIMLANDYEYEPHNLFKVRKEIEKTLFKYLTK